MRSGRIALKHSGAAVFGLADELLVSPGIIELDQHTPSTPIERRLCLLDGACCQEPRSGDCLAEVTTYLHRVKTAKAWTWQRHLHEYAHYHGEGEGRTPS